MKLLLLGDSVFKNIAISARNVVTKNLLANYLFFGVPAKMVKKVGNE